MKNLSKKMVKVLGAVSGKVIKSGYNSHQKYNYVMEADLLEAVRGELINNGIFIFSSVEEVNRGDSITTVRTKHTFVDSDSGETFEVYSAGQGADKQDKGVYKAITGASKYFLLKSFLLAGDDDPENDSKDITPTPVTKKSTPKNKTKSSFGSNKGGFGKSATKNSFSNTSIKNKINEEVDEEEAHHDSAAPLEDVPF